MNHTDLDYDSADPREEELVAYVDGELSDEQSRRVEEQLAGDGEYRQSLQRLERAWNCLDQLPATAASDTFTRSTVEMISVAASQEVSEQRAALPRQRRLRSVLTVGVLLASMLLGFFIVAVVWPDPNERLVRDLGLLKDLDMYLQIQDVSFLRSLAQEIKAADKKVFAPEVTPPPDEAASRTTTISQMSPGEKAQLASAQERFDALSPERQSAARRIYREIHQSADSTELLTTLSQYYCWTMKLSPGQRAELSGMSLEERLAGIKKIYKIQQQRLAQQLSTEDMKVLLGWLRVYVRENQREIIERLPAHEKRMMMSMRQRHGETGRRPDMMKAMRTGAILRTLSVSEEDVEQLMQVLSPRAGRLLKQVGSLQDQQGLVKEWIHRTLRIQWAQNMGGSLSKVGQADLERYFAEKLTNDQREYLLSLQGDEMQSELKRLYDQSIRITPRSTPQSGSGRPDYDRPQGRPGGPFRRGGSGGRTQGKTHRQPPFNSRPGDRSRPPSREKIETQPTSQPNL